MKSSVIAGVLMLISISLISACGRSAAPATGGAFVGHWVDVDSKAFQIDIARNENRSDYSVKIIAPDGAGGTSVTALTGTATETDMATTGGTILHLDASSGVITTNDSSGKYHRAH